VLVVTRFDVPVDDADAFVALAERALAALAEQPGYASGSVGHAVDDDRGWVLATRWDSIGSYRRALSAFDVRTTLLPLTARAVDEPGAYEVIVDTKPAPRVRVPAASSRQSGPCGPRPTQ
jgi:heme oxygenase (mycobilin-producing)